MFIFTPHLVCALLLPALFSADTAAPKCVSQEIPNMTIDVSNAVAKGARFTDPIKAASTEECVSACCSKLNSVGDQTCNLALYNTQSNGMQNCYLFFCPKRESCPMSPFPGVLSYSFWTEKEKRTPDLTEEDLLEISKAKNNGKIQNTSGKKSSPAIHANVSAESVFEKVLSKHDKQSSPSDVHSQSKPSNAKNLTKEDKADTPAHITSQLLHLANDIDKQLEKIEANSKEAKDSVSLKLSVTTKYERPLVEAKTSYRHKDLKNLSSDMDSKSDKDIRKKPEIPEVHYPTSELITSTQSVRRAHQINSTTQRPSSSTKTTVLTSTPKETTATPKATPATSKEAKVTRKAPSSGKKSTKVLSSHNSANSSSTAATVKNLQAGHPLTTTRVPNTTVVHQAKSTLPVTRHNPSRTSLLKAAKSTLKDGDSPLTSKDVQEAGRTVPELTSLEQPSSRAGDTKDAPRNLDALGTIPIDSKKSGLVAALVFGVMFLLLVIGLVSHKVSEARRRHQYTKLDYLINGMYVDT